jgi:phage shock protein C
VAERLYRSRDDRMLAGVAGGLATILDADPSIVRVAWVLLTILTGGIALVVYIVMAIVVPEGPGAAQPSSGPWSPTAAGGAPLEGVTPPSDVEARRAERRTRRNAGDPGRGGLLAGLVLIGIGGIFLIREFVPWFDWQVWWPLGLIGLGVLLLAFALRPGRPD